MSLMEDEDDRESFVQSADRSINWLAENEARPDETTTREDDNASWSRSRYESRTRECKARDRRHDF